MAKRLQLAPSRGKQKAETIHNYTELGVILLPHVVTNASLGLRVT